MNEASGGAGATRLPALLDSLPRVFSARAAGTPEAVALVQGGRRLRYGEVEIRARRLARALSARGVGPEVLVGLSIERSAEMVIALLAIQMAGGAYLPLDPRYPRARLTLMLADSAAPILVTRGRLRSALPSEGARVVDLDALEAESAEPLDEAIDARTLAYVIYTSGSTGEPKGVMVEHGGLAAMIAAQRETFAAGPESRVLQLASLGFDASIFEIAMAFGAGAELHLPDAEAQGAGPDLWRLLRERRITHLTAPPSVLASLPRDPLPDLAVVVSAGEPCPGALAAAWSEGRRFFNAYGPTEATVWATVHEHRGGADPPPIGRAIPGTTVLIVDGRGEVVGEGEPGEILIGGAGVARGYLRRPELTRARFLETPAGRVLRTGDRARALPSGDLVFLGRLDDQVKVRGFRVELGEIEAALDKHPSVAQVAVSAREDGAGERRLVAYVVTRAGHEPDPAGWRAFLAEVLPEHLIPSAFVALDALPLSPNGKVDRAALPAPSADRGVTTAYQAPRTEVERALAEIWGEVLGVAPIGVRDDFLDLGGDSLRAARIATRAGDRLRVSIGSTLALEERTVLAMARAVEALQRGGEAAPEPITRLAGEGPFPLSPAEERLWFLHQLAPSSAAYHLPIALRFRGPLDVAVLSRALDEVVARHEALRTTFVEIDGSPSPRWTPPAPVPLVMERADEDLGAEARDAHLGARAREEARRPFDLAAGPVLRATLVRLSDLDHALLLVVHHIAVDGWSMGVLARDLGAIYAARLQGHEPRLPALAVRPADHAAWQRRRLARPEAARDLDHFREALRGAPTLIGLPTDRPRPAVPSDRGARLALGIEAPTAALAALAKAQGASLFMVLLAGFAAMLHGESGEEDLVIGTPVAGRSAGELAEVIGFFANTLAIRVGLAGDPTFGEIVERVRARTLAATRHQETPFERVVEVVRPARSAAHSPIFQVMMALDDPPFCGAITPDLALSVSELGAGAAPFDLAVQLRRGEGAIEGTLDYATDLFDEATAARMMDHFARILSEGARDPDRRLSALTGGARRDLQPLADIEAALMASGEVHDCAARLTRDASGTWLRAAWVVPSRSARGVAAIAAALPASLRPDVCAAVSAIPLGPDGEVDVARLRALPAVDEALRSRCEEALRARHGSDAAAVQIEAAARRPAPRLHLADLRTTEPRSPAIASTIEAPRRVDAPPSFSDGGPLVLGAGDPETLGAALDRAARGQGRMILIGSDGRTEILPYAALLDRARRVLAGIRAAGLAAGDRAIVHADGFASVFTAFWGCVLGGVAPAIVAVAPSYDAPNAVTTKLLHAWSRLGRPPILTDRALVAAVRGTASFPEAPAGAAIRALGVEDLEAHPPAADIHEARPEDVAFLQLTSGSTGAPKAIPETHRAVIAHVHGAARRNGYAPSDVALNWMPLDHVGAILTSHLKAVYLGSTDVEVRTDRVLAEPLAWLDLIEAHRVTHTWSPNFGYKLALDALGEARDRRWDLTCLRRTMNGGEQVTIAVARAFMRAVMPFGVPRDAMQPAFGMAEIATAITYNNELDLDRDDGFIDLGPPSAGVQIRVVDGEDRVVPEGTVGRLQVRGVTVMRGYFDDEAASRAVLGADGWLTSGDLGFLRAGRLSLTGREKEMIIIRGANFPCHEIEEVAGGVAGVEPTWVGACAVADERLGSEGLAIFFVAREPAIEPATAVIAAIRARLTSSLGVTPTRVLPLPRGLFPRTTSGKIQRAALREGLSSGRFDAIRREIERAAGGVETLPDWFHRIAWHRRKVAPAIAPAERTLIFDDGSGLGARLHQRARAAGRRSILVEAAHEYARHGDDNFALDRSRRDHHDRLLFEIGAPLPDLLCWPAIDAGVEGAAPLEPQMSLSPGLRAAGGRGSGSPKAAWRPGRGRIATDPEGPHPSEKEGAPEEPHPMENAASLLVTIQAIAAANQAARPTRLFVITRGAQAIAADDAPAIGAAPLFALVETAPEELPWLDARAIDLAPGDAEHDAEIVEREVALGAKDREVAWRGGERLVMRLDRVDPRSLPERPSPWRPGGRYLLAGGLGGVGRILARRLIEDHGAHLLLVGRTPIDADPGSDRGRALADLIHAASRHDPASVTYEAADIGDAVALDRAVAAAEARWGAPLDGVVDLIGALRERLLVEETPAGLDEVLGARVRGALSLGRLLDARPGAIHLAMASVNGSLGGFSVGAYAAASRFVVEHAEARRRAGHDSRAISWSLWDEVGMSRGYAAKDLSRARGFQAIGEREGIDSLGVALARGAPHLLIGLDAGGSAATRRSAEARAMEGLGAWIAVDASAPIEVSGEPPRDRFGNEAPIRIERVAALPRTAEGAIDRAALGAPASPSGPAHVAQDSELERRVAAIWREVLRLDRVGVHDNFFDLGGHSLGLSQVRGRLRAAFGRDVAVVELFRRPTIAALAAWLGDAREERAPGEGADERAKKQRAALDKQRQRLAARRGS